MTEARIQKLIDEMKHSIAKLHDQVLSLENAVAGENPVGKAILFWKRQWKGLYGADYTMTAADKGQIKRLVNQLGLDDVTMRMSAFVGSHEPFLVKNKHPLNLFVVGINRYARPIANDPDDRYEPPPVDCKHEPPCRSDSEHTRKRMSELRA